MKTVIKSINYLLAFCFIGIAVVLAYIAIPSFGNKALIVRSGSMEPAIKTGDLIVVNFSRGIVSPVPQNIPKYSIGDIIAFKGEKDPNVLTTHRIVKNEVTNGKIYYQTKGDANNAADTQKIAEDQVIGKSILTIPSAGKIFSFAKTRQGFALLVLIPAILVILMESFQLVKEVTKIVKARKMLQRDPIAQIEKDKLVGPIGLRVLLPLIIGLMFFHNSFAFFSDSASSLNNNFTAAQSFCTATTQGGPFYASQVDSANQAKRKNGTNVLPERSNPLTTLGAPDGIGSPAAGFFALGFGGNITVKFAFPVSNVTGVDLSLHEITNGRSTYPLEKATVQVSANGTTWFTLTPEVNSEPIGDGVTFLDISSNALAPSTVNFIKITDTTNAALNPDVNSDAFDLDAVEATNLCIPYSSHSPSPTIEPTSTPSSTPQVQVEASPSASPSPTPESSPQILPIDGGGQ